ncbi:MAG: UDP-N-acetylenolpyruvoylglucosamine reductase [Verrucomicrobiales bacterium]|nr:UDP-N-acetylenolpyruvoylglucosamine reductase [Verrucomicrobiales bacterium]
MRNWTQEELARWLEVPPSGAGVYLLGAGGCGMSGLGHLLLDLGLKVFGSDLKSSGAVRGLQARGADIRVGHLPEHLSACDPAMVVYSSAMRRDNPAMMRAEQLGVPLARRAVVLAALLRRQRGVCVAGMHGKTSTTGLLAHALRELDTGLGFAVGGDVPQWERAARMPEGDGFFVVEADESDGTLREFFPEQVILLNVDEEHVDYFANLDAVCDEFEEFARQARGAVFYCADDPRLVEILSGWENAISFGMSPAADYRVELLSTESVGARFELWRGTECVGEFRLALFGAHHVSNAAAVVAFLNHNGFDMTAAAEAMADFRGVGRRQQLLLELEGVRVFDDYGHHPREIDATLRAMRGIGGERVLAAFQPHRYTRTRHLINEFATCFTAADQVWVTDVYSAGEEEIPEVNGAGLAAAVAEEGTLAAFAPTLCRLREQVRMAARSGDVIVFLGAGDITQMAHQVALDLAVESGPPAEALAALLSPESVVRADEPMARRTTLRVGGPADVYVEPASEVDLAKVLRFCAARELGWMLLGRGSNLLVRDGGIRGVVINLVREPFNRLEVRGGQMFAGAGLRLKALAHAARESGLAGLEFLEGIPGSVGGALRMNAGAMGSMTFDVVESIRYMTPLGEIHEVLAEDVESSYRSCPLLRENIALGGVFQGKTSSRVAVAGRMREFSKHRFSSQPGAKSAGCIFKNPTDCSAGKLVDELGLKGLRVGGAVVSDVHGNFIVNDGDATAAEVLELIGKIKERVLSDRGIELRTEVQVVGE